MARGVLACASCLRRAVLMRSEGATLADAGRLMQRGRPFATAVSPVVVDAPRSVDPKPADLALLSKKDQDRLRRSVDKQLSLMDDPYHIAQYVEQALQRNAFDEALLLVQKASKDKKVVVAWNHLIDHQLNNDKLKNAIKLYNDMKKRAQLPSVRTFTILFRGLAKSKHPKLAVAEAVKHYNILMNDTRLEPNSIHLNAVLNVCAKAGDLDSMFLIADTINESTRAPSAYTYTVIFNALRHSAEVEARDLSNTERYANVRKAVNQGKNLWPEIMHKWKAGKLVIDEQLICAMGRLLLRSPDEADKKLVFDFMEQSMSIPNLMERAAPEAFQDETMRGIAVSGPSKPVPHTKNAVFAVPGRNTLAMVLTAASSIKQTTSGIKYWNLLVRHYGVIPDKDTWVRMFGMLRIAHASTHAAEVLELVPDEYINPKIFSVAMETCVDDNINDKAVANSVKVLNAMMQKLSIPDLQTLRLYLRVSLVAHRRFRSQAKDGDSTEAKRQYGVQITEALARLWEPYKKLHYHYFKSAKPKDKGEAAILYNDKREVIALARQMYSAFNKVINEHMLPEEDLKELRPVGAKINREIQLFYANREAVEPKLRTKSEEESSDLQQEPTESTVENTEEKEDTKQARQGKGFVWNTSYSSAELNSPTDNSPWLKPVSRRPNVSFKRSNPSKTFPRGQ